MKVIPKVKSRAIFAKVVALLLCALASARATYAQGISGNAGASTGGGGGGTIQGLGTAGTPTGGLLTIQGDPAGTPVPVTGTLSVSGAGNTIGGSVSFTSNACATVWMAGQNGVGFNLAAGTSAATYTASISGDATQSGNNCTGGNWTPTALIDPATRLPLPTLTTSNPNSAGLYSVQVTSGVCARVCVGTAAGTASGFLEATVAKGIPGNISATQSGAWTVASTQSGVWTVAATQSGAWNIGNITGTVTLPTGAATSAKQPALGTAGAASADVITIQGISGMTPVDDNLKTIAGTAPTVGNGTTGAGTLRVTISSDSTGQVNVANTVTVTGTVTTSPPANASTNVAQIAGTATATGNGATNAGTQRVTLSNDSTGQVTVANTVTVSGTVTTSPPANASTNVAQVNGVTTAVGNGTTSTGTQRVTLSSDSTGQVAIAGTVTVTGTVTANAGSGTFTNQQSNITADYDTGGGTQTMTMFGFALPASGGAVAGGTATNPIRFDPTGTTPQPVTLSAQTITVTQGTAANLNATVTGTVTIGAGSAVMGHVIVDSGTITATATVAGDVASGSANSGNPLQDGGRAATALPTAVADGQRVGLMLDKFGRIVTAANGDRNLITQNEVTLTASTSETTILTAGGSGVFLDVTFAKCSNSSSTASVISFRDATAGTVRFTIICPAQIGPCEGQGYNTPWKQTTANNNWTIQAGASGSSYICDLQAVQNK